MGLIDKIKDLFTDEEEVYETKEVEIENSDEEDKLPTFMRNKIEKEEEEERIKQEKIEQEEKQIAVQIENTSVSTSAKEKKNLSFDFNDDDFVDVTKFSRSNVQKEKQIEQFKERETVPVIKPYSNKKEIDKPKKFKPTPVISPVYGILDKNYKTEEVVSKDEDAYAIQRASKKVDFESVRKKAYGTLSDDIKANLCENCELLKEIKVNNKIERLTEEDLLYNMTTDDVEKDYVVDETYNINTEEEKKEEDITLGEATENYADFGVTYEIPPQRERKHDEEVKIVNHADEEVVVEKVEVKEEENKEIEKIDRQKDLELTDDLFNLIDSMYKERDD